MSNEVEGIGGRITALFRNYLAQVNANSTTAKDTVVELDNRLRTLGINPSGIVPQDDPRLTDARDWNAPVATETQMDNGTDETPVKTTPSLIHRAINAVLAKLGLNQTRLTAITLASTAEWCGLKTGAQVFVNLSSSVGGPSGLTGHAYVSVISKRDMDEGTAFLLVDYANNAFYIGSTASKTTAISWLRLGTLNLTRSASILGVTKSAALNGSMSWSAAELKLNGSLAASGWQKLPSGFILQWGQATINYTNANNTITFPIAFPNACLTGWTNLRVAESRSGLWVSGFVPINTSTCNFFGCYTNDGRSLLSNWFAIGY